MNSNDLKIFEEHIRELEKFTPSIGGNISICEGPGRRGEVIIDGDRVALIRLSMAILKYVVNARFKEGHFKIEAKSMDDFFLPPSRTRELFIQIDETPPDKQKSASRPPSLTKLVGRALFPKRRE